MISSVILELLPYRLFEAPNFKAWSRYRHQDHLLACKGTLPQGHLLACKGTLPQGHLLVETTATTVSMCVV
jgi:hypothetical protein